MVWDLNDNFNFKVFVNYCLIRKKNLERQALPHKFECGASHLYSYTQEAEA